MNLETLYLEHEPRIRWVIRARGVPEASVDDLVHESFVTIHRRLPQRDPAIPLATWVAGVARNVAFSHRRTEARRQRQLRTVPAPAAAVLPDDALAERDAWRAVEGFASTLSPKLREVFLLAEVGGVPVSAIGRITGVPLPTLHSRLRLARRRFEDHFEALRDEPARRAMLAAAAEEQASTPAAQRRSIAALMAAVGGPKAAVVGAGTGAGWGLGTKVAVWTTAAALVGTLAVVASDRSDASHERAAARAEAAAVGTPLAATTRPDSPPAKTPTPPSAIDAAVEIPPHLADPAALAAPARAAAANADAPPRSTEKPSASTSSTAPTDALAAHVDALARARTLATTGRYAAALSVLDAVDPRKPALARDHHRLELRAACGAENAARVATAAAALRALGLPVDSDHPCAAEEKGGVQ